MMIREFQSVIGEKIGVHQVSNWSLNMKKNEYLEKLNKYKEYIINLGVLDLDEDRLEFHFETLKDWSLFHTFSEVEKWYKNVIKKKEMTVEEIPLSECKKWIVNDDEIYHESKEFFSIKGLRVKTSIREAERGWDQPIVKQVGFDGGILGVIRKRFDGVPHYLLEAKFEPGNVNLVQFSPTLQATLSNMSAAHKGYIPHYLDYFLNTEEHKVHFSNWLCEDGGRLYNKRNLNMLIEIDEPIEIVNDNFIWMSLYQIRYFIKRYDWVNSHVRGIFSFI